MEREKGFEPSTSTLARLRSTPELLPHPLFMAEELGLEPRLTESKSALLPIRGFLNNGGPILTRFG